MARDNQIAVAFVVARDGPSVFDEVSQAERKALIASLTAQGVPYSYPDRHGMTFDAVGELLEIVVSSGIAFRSIKPVLIEWIKGRAGQKVRIACGDKRVEAPDIDAAERAWRLISPTTESEEA